MRITQVTTEAKKKTVKKPIKRYKVVYRYPRQKAIVAGNFLFVDATSPREARKFAKEKLENSYGPPPTIAWCCEDV